MLEKKWFILSIVFLADLLFLLYGANPALTPFQRTCVWVTIACLAATNGQIITDGVVKYLPILIENVAVFFVVWQLKISRWTKAHNIRK
jgi:hypothetical protein